MHLQYIKRLMCYTGKTIQVIAFLRALVQKHAISGPHLIVMPLSVISSWKADLQKFGGDSFDIYVHHGEKQGREQSFCTWYRAVKGNTRQCRPKIFLLITTYELTIKDEHLLSRLGRRSASVSWQYLIVRAPRHMYILIDLLRWHSLYKYLNMHYYVPCGSL